MNMLIDVLPTEVEIDGTWYCLNTDYRICIMFEMLMMDDTLDDTQKLRKALELFFGDVIPTNATSAVDKILWFYNCGKDMDQERKTRGQRAKAFFDRDTPSGLRQRAIIKTASSYEPPNLMNRKRKWRL